MRSLFRLCESNEACEAVCKTVTKKRAKHLQAVHSKGIREADNLCKRQPRLLQTFLVTKKFQSFRRFLLSIIVPHKTRIAINGSHGPKQIAIAWNRKEINSCPRKWNNICVTLCTKLSQSSLATSLVLFVIALKRCCKIGCQIDIMTNWHGRESCS